MITYVIPVFFLMVHPEASISIDSGAFVVFVATEKGEWCDSAEFESMFDAQARPRPSTPPHAVPDPPHDPLLRRRLVPMIHLGELLQATLLGLVSQISTPVLRRQSCEG